MDTPLKYMGWNNVPYLRTLMSETSLKYCPDLDKSEVTMGYTSALK